MRLLLLSIAIIICVSARADDTTRPKLKRAVKSDPVEAVADTIRALGGEVVISGYDKPLNSRKETFHVTSTLPSTITGLEMTLVYTDLQGRTLHSVTRMISCDIPPYATRMVTIPSWDPQCRYYYARGKATRAAGVTPYLVTTIVERIVIMN